MTRRSAILWALLFTAAAGLFLSDFFVGRTHFAGDVTFSFQPWLTYAAQEIQAGRFPHWSGLTSCGEPFAANPQVMAFSPAAVLFWTFPFTAAWRSHLLANQALLFIAAGLLATAFVRRRGPAALAALAVAWGGFSVVNWEFPAAGATLPYLVFVVLFAARGRPAAVAAATALLFFAGYTPFAVYGLTWAGAIAAARAVRIRRASPAVLWAAGVAAGIAIALVQIVPSWELTGLSLRGAVTREDALRYLLTPSLLLKIVVPNIVDKVALAFSPGAFGPAFWPVQRNWLSTFYIGTAPLLLALVALTDRQARRGPWAAAAALSLLFAMGVEPVFSAVRTVVPGLKHMTHFSNAALIAVTAAALLAARGARSNAARRLRIAGFGLAALCAGMSLWPGGLRRALEAMLDLAAPTPAQLAHAAGAFRETAGFAALAALAAFLGRGRNAALLALVLAELAFNARGMHPTAPASFFDERPALAARYAGTTRRVAWTPDAMNRRVMAGDNLVDGYRSLRAAGCPATLLPYRVPSPWTYDVFALKEYVAVRRRLDRASPAGPLYDFFAVEGALAASDLPPPHRPAARAPHALLYENAGALDRVFAVGRSTAIPDAERRLRYLESGWDPRREVVLESAGISVETAPRLARWSDGPDRTVFQGSGAGWVVQSEAWHPGWAAYVNGRRTELRRANHAFRATALPDGDWRGVWIYRPGSWAAAAAAAALAVTCLTAAAFRRARAIAAPGGAP